MEITNKEILEISNSIRETRDPSTLRIHEKTDDRNVANMNINVVPITNIIENKEKDIDPKTQFLEILDSMENDNGVVLPLITHCVSFLKSCKAILDHDNEEFMHQMEISINLGLEEKAYLNREFENLSIYYMNLGNMKKFIEYSDLCKKEK